MMKKAIIAFALVLVGCGSNPDYILVITTLDVKGSATGTTAIKEFQNKEKCQLAGEQWRSSLSNQGTGAFTCLEPK